jgi:hypothetical protein
MTGSGQQADHCVPIARSLAQYFAARAGFEGLSSSGQILSMAFCALPLACNANDLAPSATLLELFCQGDYTVTDAQKLHVAKKKQ